MVLCPKGACNLKSAVASRDSKSKDKWDTMHIHKGGVPDEKSLALGRLPLSFIWARHLERGF